MTSFLQPYDEVDADDLDVPTNLWCNGGPKSNPCDGREFYIVTEVAPTPGVVRVKCKKCGRIYRLVPSTYIVGGDVKRVNYPALKDGASALQKVK